MAINYQDLVEFEKNRSLTPQELKEVDAVEKYIDEFITTQFYNGNNTFDIDLSIWNFSYNPITKSKTKHIDIIRKRMNHLLLSKYTKFWKCTISLDDSDSMNSYDKVIFKPLKTGE